MPPPKVKLHKSSGKARPGPPLKSRLNNQLFTLSNPQPNSSISISNTGVSLTEDQEQQFQSELYWCIKQLQTALSTNKLNEKQVQEHTKTLNTLMSHNAPIVKKRQVMRLSFGDYRSKMMEDEKKGKKISIKIHKAKPSEKSVFLKKAFSNSNGSDFKFNFPTPKAEEIEEQLNQEETVSETKTPIKKHTPHFVFMKSDNVFRFNFSSEDIQNNIEIS